MPDFEGTCQVRKKTQGLMILCASKIQQQQPPNFLFQVSWDRLEMKPHEKKKGLRKERKIRGK
jgi:hypothetical protein